MAATLSVSRSVKIDGMKGEWNIKDKDTKQCNGVLYVKMCVRSSSLSTMVGNVGGSRCLYRSIGFRKLRELKEQRTEEQLDSQPDAAADACTLFDDVPTQRPRKVPKVAPKSRLETSSGVELEVNGETVTVEILLSNQKDTLFVAFEAENIQTLIKYIMEAGFDEEKVVKKKDKDHADVQELPVGVWRHGKGYSVGYTDTNGKKCRKYKNSLEAALRFYADPSEDTSDDDKDELCES